jgi:hypothetical protein
LPEIIRILSEIKIVDGRILSPRNDTESLLYSILMRHIYLHKNGRIMTYPANSSQCANHTPCLFMVLERILIKLGPQSLTESISREDGKKLAGCSFYHKDEDINAFDIHLNATLGAMSRVAEIQLTEIINRLHQVDVTSHDSEKNKMTVYDAKDGKYISDLPLQNPVIPYKSRHADIEERDSRPARAPRALSSRARPQEGDAPRSRPQEGDAPRSRPQKGDAPHIREQAVSPRGHTQLERTRSPSRGKGWFEAITKKSELDIDDFMAKLEMRKGAERLARLDEELREKQERLEKINKAVKLAEEDTGIEAEILRKEKAIKELNATLQQSAAKLARHAGLQAEPPTAASSPPVVKAIPTAPVTNPAKRFDDKIHRKK